MLAALILTEGLLRLKNLDQSDYSIEMWRYAKLLKMISPDPVLGHVHRPGSSAKLEGVMVRINSFGLRGPEIQTQGQRHHLRVLFLGSSNTLGWGVEENSTLPADLQKEMGREAEVLNGGIGNYNAVRYVHLFETRLRALKPDLVIVHFFISDAKVLGPEGGNFLLRHSELAVKWVEALDMFQMGTASRKGRIGYYKNLYKDDFKGYLDMVAAFQRLDAMAKEDGFKVILAVTPDSHDLADFPYKREYDKIKNLGSRLGWMTVDFTPSLQLVPQAQLWIMPSDPHYNAQGLQIMAEAIGPAVKASLSRH